MSEFDFKKHPFIPLYGDQPIPFFNEEYSKQRTVYSTDFRGGQLDKQPYIMPFEVDDPEFIVLICPGGGYFACGNSASADVAIELNRRNITAFVLSYRTGDREAPENSYNCHAILQDGVRAMQYVRNYANDRGLADKKIVALGFSAGGHLALTLSLGLSDFNTLHDEIGQLSEIPDAVIAGYPCTTFREGAFPTLSPIFAARESDETRNALDERFTLMHRVDSNTPPTFIYYGTADRAVPPEYNAIPYFFALQKAGVKSAIVGYENLGHGIGLAKKTAAEGWLSTAIGWIEQNVL